MSAASPDKMTGNTANPAENPVLPHVPEPAQCRDTGMPTARRNARLPHNQPAARAPQARAGCTEKTEEPVWKKVAGQDY